jgi:EmrB/QacA subfamily drug resistance transporter
MTVAADAPPARKMQILLILLCVSIPSFMINLDSNIVAVSLPSIAQSLHADFSAIEWVISAYTLTFASLLMPAGALADRYGRKRMLLIGLSIFTFASLVCGAATSAPMLNYARAFQGVGAAIQLSAALATLSHSFRGKERAKAFAFWGSVIGVAIALGPVAGGFITHFFGWQWAFYVNIPVGIAMIGLTSFSLEESRDPNANKIDILGFATFSSSLFLITLCLISGNRYGWDSLKILSEAFLAMALFAAFILVEKRQSRPMLDLRFFREPTYIGANIAGVAYAATLLSMLTFIPVFLQSGLSFSPQKAGLLMLPIAVPLIVIPRIVGSHLAYRFSGRGLLTVGLLLVSLGLLWIATRITDASYLSLLGGMLLAGCGAGILNGEIAKVSMAVIPPERAGMASGVSGTARFSGIVVGFAGLGAVLFSGVSKAVMNGNTSLSGVDLETFIRSITVGNLQEQAGSSNASSLHALAIYSFQSGYQTMIVVASALAFCASIAVLSLGRFSETQPLTRNSNNQSVIAVPSD